MTKAEDYAKVFRGAQKGAMETAWKPGMGTTGDYRDIAQAMAGAFGGIAAVFENIAKAEPQSSNKSEKTE